MILSRELTTKIRRKENRYGRIGCRVRENFFISKNFMFCKWTCLNTGGKEPGERISLIAFLLLLSISPRLCRSRQAGTEAKDLAEV